MVAVGVLLHHCPAKLSTQLAELVQALVAQGAFVQAREWFEQVALQALHFW